MHTEYNQQLFFELLQISLGRGGSFSKVPSVLEWEGIFLEAQRQAIVGVMVDGLEKLPEAQRPPQALLLQWIGQEQMMSQTYKTHYGRAREVTESFCANSFNSCVLKGIGLAQKYPNPHRRQLGDIDIWVEGQRDDIIEYLRKKGNVGHIDVKHCDWRVFPDVEVEVHFIPTWFYNPFTNKRLKKWFEWQKEAQFTHKSDIGINTPTTAFNLVYLLIHIYRHLFDEGVGLRQLVDYYYVLNHSTDEERDDAISVLSSLRMKRFVGASMYVMQEVFGMDARYLLCKPLKKDGQFILNEIMRSGNFGHYDERNKHYKSRWANGLEDIKRNVRFLWRYPQEVCWMPAWKMWHYFWRKRKGYL